MKNHPRTVLIIMAYLAFVALGMPDGLLGVAWPSIRDSFSVPLDSAGLLLSAFVAGYLISSISSGPLVSRMGIGKLLAASCAVTGTGLIGYTVAPHWWMMILLGSVAGLGAGAIDSGLNAYAAAHFNAGLMQWLHACYGIGITLGPVIMTSALTFMHSWRAGYLIVGGFQIVLSVCFVFMIPVWNQRTEKTKTSKKKTASDYRTPLTETLRVPGVWLSMLLFLLYAGCEVSFGTWAYILLTDARGAHPELAGLLVGGYWASFTAGRISAGVLAKHTGMNQLVTINLVTAFCLTALLWWNPLPLASLLAVPLTGLAIAPIFPALVSETSGRVGTRFSANTIGMQMAASALGIALVPGVTGVLARQLSLEMIPVSLMILLAALLGLHIVSAKSCSA